MSYATVTDLRQWIDEDILIQLTDDANTGSTDTDVVDTILAAASLQIDGYLGGRYSLPLATVPPILGKLCVDIAGWLLYARRNAGVPEHWQKLYDNAIAFLGKVAVGKITLGADDPIKAAGSDQATVTGEVRRFSRTGLEDW